MPSIPQIAKALDSLGLEYQESEDYVMLSCPFASKTHTKREDTNPSFRVTSEYCHCFSCGYNNDLEQFLEQYREFSGKTGDFDFDFECYIRPKRQKEDEPNVILNEEILKTLEKNDRIVRDYLDSRGIWIESLDDIDIYYDGVNKIVVPVRNQFGQLVGSTSRSIKEWGAKSHHFWGFSTKFELLGAQHHSHNKCLIVEGMTDYLSAKCNIKRLNLAYDVYCLFGCVLHEPQAELLAEFGSTVYLALDMDEAGKKGRREAKKLLSENYVIEKTWNGGRDGKEIDIGNMCDEQFLFLFG